MTQICARVMLPAAYLNDTRIGALAISFSVLIPMTGGLPGSKSLSAPTGGCKRCCQ
jgi:hypothetical protein